MSKIREEGIWGWASNLRKAPALPWGHINFITWYFFGNLEMFFGMVSECICSDHWLSASPDLNPLDYDLWSVLQDVTIIWCH